ncbi:MAG: hypothetical protein ACRDFR_01735 [Candidatus Limnocylindria bacterium]
MSPLVRRLIAIVTLILALAVIAVLTLRAFGVPIAIGPLASPTPLPAPSVTPSSEASPSLEEALAAIEADVADLRDLPPADTEPAEFVSRAELERRLATQFAEDYPAVDVAADNALLRALGLLSAEQDVAALRLQLLTGQVLGYYDDVTQTMVIVSDAGLTPEAQVTYAHEYTHALQDAAFGIDSMDLDAEGDDDGAFARLGLVEGDATTAMVLWAIDHLRAEDLLEISQTPLPDTTGVPDWMLRELEFPYLAGAEFVAQLYAQGGFAAVDEVWADPPASTEQVLHMRAYIESEPPVSVPEIDPDIRALGVDIAQDTTFGEAMIGIWLAYHGVDQVDADTAAAGWGGDRITALVTPEGQSAIILRIAWDSAVDADQFESAYADALAALPVFGQLDRVSETEIVVTQASTQALLDTLAGLPV